MAKTKEERLAARAAKNAAKYKDTQDPVQANAGSQPKNQAAPQQAQALSPEAIQKRDLALLLKPCRSKKELNAWIKYFLDLELPDVTVSRYASSNPLEAVWEMYRICVLKQNPENIQEVLYTSSRGAGKTLSVAVAEFMILLHDQRDMAHIGAIMAQAKRAFDYVQGFCNIPKIKRLIDPPKVRPENKILQKMIMEKTIFNINGVQCMMEILPATLTALNGLHCIGGKTHLLIDNSNGAFKSSRVKLPVSAKKVYEAVKSGKSINVFSFNHKTNQIESKPILAAISNGKRPRLKISRLSGSPLWCTTDHKIYDPISKTYKEASTFKVGDKILITNKAHGNKDYSNVEPIFLPKKTANTYNEFEQIIIGSLLGDGSVNKRHPHLRTATYIENHGPKQIQYALWKKSILSKYIDFLQDGKSKSGYKADSIGIRIASKATQKLEKYANFKKTFDNDILSAIDSLALAVWYMDDGHKDHFCTHGFSTENLNKLIDVIYDKFNIKLKIKPKLESNGKHYNLLYFASQVDYANFYLLVKDHIHESMSYKFDTFTGKYRCSSCGKEEFRINTNNNSKLCLNCTNDNHKNWKLDSIASIEFLPQKREVFDFEVKDNNNFIAGGMLVHNCSLVSIDELDTLPPAGRAAIKDAAGMLDTKRGKKPLRVGISTRKSKHGIMNRMIENAEKEGRHLRFWTALEFTERCPDSRSGTTPTAYWVDGHSGEVLTPDEFAQKDESKKKNFQLETQMWENCKRCPLAVFCRGDAKKQVSQSNMLKSIDELNQKIRSEGLEWAAAQLFNLKPSSEGVVYREFDEQLHIKSWNDMWLQLTGKEFPGECTHDIFIKKCHEMKLNCTAGIDWGFSNPNTVVYFFTDKRDNVYVVRADGMTQISEPMWIELLRTKYHTMYRCQLYIPDPANQGAILEMKKQGLPVVNFNKGEINAGIQVIKKFLRVPGGGKDATKVFIARDTCKPLIDEFQLYHYKANQAGEATDTPDTEHDHWLDAFRYAMSYLYGKNTVYLADGLDIPSKAEIMTIDGSYKRMPTPAEFAAINGAPLNDQDQNIGTLGKVGTASELASDGVDDDAGSDNSFIWSF